LTWSRWQVVGPRVNARWLNLLAGFIVSVLLLLSGILMATTLFPHVDATHVGEYLAVALAVIAGLALLALKFTTRGRPASQPAPAMSKRDKLAWRVPPGELTHPAANQSKGDTRYFPEAFPLPQACYSL
jgi:hypothetical protein